MIMRRKLVLLAVLCLAFAVAEVLGLFSITRFIKNIYMIETGNAFLEMRQAGGAGVR